MPEEKAPYVPSEDEINNAASQQTVMQREMGKLRGPDVEEALAAGNTPEGLHGIIPLEVSEFSDDEKKFKILYEGHEIDCEFRPGIQEPYRLRVDYVQIMDEERAEKVFKKLFPAARLVKHDQTKQDEDGADYDTWASDGDEEIGNKYSIGAVYPNGDYTPNTRDSYETRAARMVAASPQLQQEAAGEPRKIKEPLDEEEPSEVDEHAAEEERAEREQRQKDEWAKEYNAAIAVTDGLLK